MSDAKKNKKQSLIKEYLSYVIIIVIVILFKKFVFTPIKVNGDSMKNTLHDGDIMILNIIGYKTSGLDRFDIVVIKENNEFIIKRVIGLPGDEVKYKDNKLYINGKKINDKYGIGDTDDFAVKVPKNKYFVLGDNRENSLDSRYFGAFKEKSILGKTKLIIFPFSRIGNKN